MNELRQICGFRALDMRIWRENLHVRDEVVRGWALARDYTVWRKGVSDPGEWELRCPSTARDALRSGWQAVEAVRTSHSSACSRPRMNGAPNTTAMRRATQLRASWGGGRRLVRWKDCSGENILLLAMALWC